MEGIKGLLVAVFVFAPSIIGMLIIVALYECLMCSLDRYDALRERFSNKKLRPYQQVMLDAMKSNKKIAIYIPMGAGKTMLFRRKEK